MGPEGAGGGEQVTDVGEDDSGDRDGYTMAGEG